MKKKKVKKRCSKCNYLHFCDEHHILPKKIFGIGETVPLCKNCHDIYHLQLGQKFTQKKQAQPKEFYLQNWVKWITLAGIFGIILILFN